MACGGDGTGRRRASTRLGSALLAALASLLLTSAALGATFQATEGAQFAGGSVPALQGCQSSSASVNWGDGGPSSSATCDVASNTVATGPHTYAEEASRNGVVSYTSFNGPATSSFTVTVADGSITASSAGIAATAGTPFAGSVAHLADGDPGGFAADYGVSVNWGDGTPASAATVTSAPGGGFAVSGGHTYATLGSFPLTITA